MMEKKQRTIIDKAAMRARAKGADLAVAEGKNRKLVTGGGGGGVAYVEENKILRSKQIE
jgi:hypothetical protein